jgi:hypothetical protein
VIAGAADSVMAAPLVPVAGTKLPKAGSSDIHVMDSDKHSEAQSQAGGKAAGALTDRSFLSLGARLIPRLLARLIFGSSR